MAKVRCWICGKEYDYCSNCRRYETWKVKTCSELHYQINFILEELREGVLTKLEAKNKLNNIGVNDEYDFTKMLSSVSDVIKNILKTKPKRTVKKTNITE